MTTKNKHSYSAYAESKEVTAGQRSSRCIITPEARVLRDLRLKHGYSMKELGKLVGCSDSFISHLENGRADLPKGETLQKLLKSFGGIGAKYFFELVRDKKSNPDDMDVIKALTDKLKPQQAAYVREVIEDILKGR